MDVQVRPDVAAAESSAESGRRRYRAFISYGHHDKAIATRLHRKLESYRVPSRLRGTQGTFGPLPERMAPIFLDREDLASAGELGASIRAALADSDALIVVCSRAAAHSRWVDNEVLEFKRLGRAQRVYCLIVDGEPGDPAHECFPPALRFELDADGQIGTQPAEPLAADLRPGGDGWPLAVLKLLSGLLGVDLDMLRQREAHRRHRRMLAITAASVLAMLVTSFLAVQAIIARNDAQRRQKQAEALVGFMLGDLTDKLNEVSRLDILEAVDDHAMAYFQSLPVADVTDTALEQRAKAYIRIGDVRRSQGHLPQALESFEAAEVLNARLARAQPGNLTRQLAWAENLTYLGTAHWYRGDLVAAQHRFDAARDVLERARQFSGDDPTLLYQLAQVDNNLGHVLEARGALNAARVAYQRVRETMRALVKRDGASPAWNRMLGLAHNNLAKLALLDGDLTAAIAGYRADVAIESMLARRNPRDKAQAEAVLLAQAALGRTLALAGDLDGGIAQLRQALAGVQELHDIDRSDTGYTEDVALYATQLAGLLRLRGERTAAEALIAQALPLFDALVTKDGGNAAWRRERAEAWIEHAELLHVAGKGKAAQAAARSALHALEPMLAATPGDRAIVLATVAARLALAAANADPREAANQQRMALTTLESQTSGLRDPRLLALRARVRPPPDTSAGLPTAAQAALIRDPPSPP